MNNPIDNTKLTSVKILKELYNQFKRVTVDEKITLQQFVNRSLNLYVSDIEFKKKINEYSDLSDASGSHF